MKKLSLILPANYSIKMNSPHCKFVNFETENLIEMIDLEDKIKRYYLESRIDGSKHILDVLNDKIVKIDNLDMDEIESETNTLTFGIFNLLDKLGSLTFLDGEKNSLPFKEKALKLMEEYKGARLKSNRFYKEFTKYRPAPIVKLFQFESNKYIKEYYPSKGIEMGIKNGDFILEFDFTDDFSLTNSHLNQAILCDIRVIQNENLDEDWHNPYLKENPVNLKLLIPYYLFESLTDFFNRG